MPQFQDYFGQAALRPQADIPRSLDQLYDLYLRRKQAKAQEAQTAQAGNLFALEQGFNPNQVTPENIAQAQGPANMAESPAIAAMRQYIERKKGTRDLETRKTEAEINKLNKTGGKTEDDFTRESNVRKEFSALPAVKEYSTVRDAFSRIQSIGAKPSAAGDLALIFSYMKILDPGSTVREGEFANAQNAGGVPDKVQAMYNKIRTGERLSENQRADFLERSKDLYSSQRRVYEGHAAGYRALAERLGVSPENVIVDTGLPAVPGAGALKPAADPESRFNALKAQGLSDDEAYKRMAQEGL